MKTSLISREVGEAGRDISQGKGRGFFTSRPPCPLPTTIHSSRALIVLPHFLCPSVPLLSFLPSYLKVFRNQPPCEGAAAPNPFIAIPIIPPPLTPSVQDLPLSSQPSTFAEAEAPALGKTKRLRQKKRCKVVLLLCLEGNLTASSHYFGLF